MGDAEPWHPPWRQAGLARAPVGITSLACARLRRGAGWRRAGSRRGADGAARWGLWGLQGQETGGSGSGRTGSPSTVSCSEENGSAGGASGARLSPAQGPQGVAQPRLCSRDQLTLCPSSPRPAVAPCSSVQGVPGAQPSPREGTCCWPRWARLCPRRPWEHRGHFGAKGISLGCVPATPCAAAPVLTAALLCPGKDASSAAAEGRKGFGYGGF